ncbi:MAG: hypothetical protein M0T74_06945 [Desulfitobacterium hafniense]|nr:hypothetical protein [Desulfitobacterium hafniense]
MNTKNPDPVRQHMYSLVVDRKYCDGERNWLWVISTLWRVDGKNSSIASK